MNENENLLDKTWNDKLDNIKNTSLFTILVNNVLANEKNNLFFPTNRYLLFNSFNLCPWKDLKLVIVGTPIIDPNSNIGLSLGRKNKYNEDIENIYPHVSINSLNFELILKAVYGNDDFEIKDKTFRSSAFSGILFLPTVLSITYNDSKVNTILKSLWKKFILQVLSKIAEYKKNIVFVYLGTSSTKLMYPIFSKGFKKGHSSFLIPGDLEALAYRPNSLDINGLKSALKAVERKNKKKIEW